MMSDEEPASLTPAAAAEFLGVSAQSMEKWRAQRTGPEYFKLSAKAVRYRLVTLRRWRDATVLVCGRLGAK
jgi:helix-turn-helix protein